MIEGGILKKYYDGKMDTYLRRWRRQPSKESVEQDLNLVNIILKSTNTDEVCHALKLLLDRLIKQPKYFSYTFGDSEHNGVINFCDIGEANGLYSGLGNDGNYHIDISPRLLEQLFANNTTNPIERYYNRKLVLVDILVTLGHEFTHHLQNTNPDKSLDKKISFDYSRHESVFDSESRDLFTLIIPLIKDYLPEDIKEAVEHEPEEVIDRLNFLQYLKSAHEIDARYGGILFYQHLNSYWEQLGFDLSEFPEQYHETFKHEHFPAMMEYENYQNIKLFAPLERALTQVDPEKLTQLSKAIERAKHIQGNVQDFSSYIQQIRKVESAYNNYIHFIFNTNTLTVSEKENLMVELLRFGNDYGFNTGISYLLAENNDLSNLQRKILRLLKSPYCTHDSVILSQKLLPVDEKVSIIHHFIKQGNISFIYSVIQELILEINYMGGEAVRYKIDIFDIKKKLLKIYEGLVKKLSRGEQIVLDDYYDLYSILILLDQFGYLSKEELQVINDVNKEYAYTLDLNKLSATKYTKNYSDDQLDSLSTEEQEQINRVLSFKFTEHS